MPTTRVMESVPGSMDQATSRRPKFALGAGENFAERFFHQAVDSSAKNMNFKLTTSEENVKQGAVSSQDLGEKGDSPGDLIEFYGAVNRDGKQAGRVTGLIVTVDMPNAVVGVANRKEGMSFLSFVLSDGQILVAGTGLYPVTDDLLATEEPTMRVVIGGTKAYFGARGQVTTTKKPDGSWDFEFDIQLPVRN